MNRSGRHTKVLRCASLCAENLAPSHLLLTLLPCPNSPRSTASCAASQTASHSTPASTSRTSSDTGDTCSPRRGFHIRRPLAKRREADDSQGCGAPDRRITGVFTKTRSTHTSSERTAAAQRTAAAVNEAARSISLAKVMVGRRQRAGLKPRVLTRCGGGATWWLTANRIASPPPPLDPLGVRKFH